LLAGNDAALLQDMARYFASDSRGFVFGCESMGVPSQQYALPLAEMIAMNLGIKIWGAKTAMGTVDSTVFEQQNGQWAISDMYLGVPRTSADYRNVPALAMSGWTAVRTNNGVELDWSALSNSNTESFDVQRSKDGKVFERIGKVAKNGSGSYTFTDASPPQSDTLTYRISRRDSSPAPGHNDGSNDYTFAFSETREVGGVIGIGNNHEQPAKFELLQNYPNPFNSSTIIHYSIPKDEKVVLRLYNILGQEIATPINSIEKAGQHNITFDASNLASGIYFYRIDAGDEKAVKKMVLVK
ncbi:MAG: T9SS type A sorting domain-containing protein, partial [Candidatus Micrarchaeota archaeon]|nr:T9SS type A sorting domain-containing protein [Candidatus Micrarchaeota archaeon]